MQLSKKDRVRLINQYRILASLYPNEAGHYEELIEILQSGYEIFYSMIDDWVSDDMPKDEGRIVLDILNMYRMIEDFKRVNKDKEIEEHPWRYFIGFDGNNETSHMAFARFLILKQGKFLEQEPYLKLNDSCNSHMPTLDKYRNMRAKWKDFDDKFKLSKDQILEILNS